MLDKIGGSATNDGGMGCMRALGVRFFAADGRELSGFGNELADIAVINTSGLDKRISECTVLLYYNAALRMFRMIRSGIEIK